MLIIIITAFLSSFTEKLVSLESKCSWTLFWFRGRIHSQGRKDVGIFGGPTLHGIHARRSTENL